MEALDKILDVILIGIWITSVTYLLGLLIRGWFGKWKQHKQLRLMMKQEDGDPINFNLFLRKKDDE